MGRFKGKGFLMKVEQVFCAPAGQSAIHLLLLNRKYYSSVRPLDTEAETEDELKSKLESW